MPRYKRKPKPPYVPKQPHAAPAAPSVPEPSEDASKTLSPVPAEAPHVQLPKRVPARYKKKRSVETPPAAQPSAAEGTSSVTDETGHLRVRTKQGPERVKKAPPTAPVHGNPRRKIPEPSPEKVRERDVLKRRDTAPFTLPALIFEKETMPEEWSGREMDDIPIMPVRPLLGGYISHASNIAAIGAPYPAENAEMSTAISRHKIRRTIAALIILSLSAVLLYFGIQYSVNEIRKYSVSHTVTVAGDTYPTDVKALDMSGKSLSDEELLSLSKMHNLTSLTLRNTNIASLETVSRLPYLETLIIADCPGISDLSPLKKLANLTVLDISGCTGITDIGPLASLQNLTSLELNRCEQIMDLTPLENLTGLVSLGLADLSYQQDLKILSGMTKLRNLNIMRTDVGDLNVLSGFANLTKLQVQIHSAADFSVLEKHQNLTSLSVDLSLYDLADLSFLSGFRRLEEFALTGDSKIRDIGELSLHPDLISLVIEDAGGIPDLNALSKLKSLKTLTLFRCFRIGDIGPLKGLFALETLRLSKGSFTDISPVSGLKALTELEITDTPVADISALWDLRQLEKLSLESTDVYDLTVLKNLAYLRELDIQDTDVKDISVISGFTNLVSLNIGKDAVSDFSAVSGLLKLTDFRASGTGFTNIVYLSRLSGLKVLDLSDTSIRDISGLPALPNLESLDLSGTVITDISPLSEIVYLRSLNLDNTGVTDLQAAAGLIRLTELRIGTGTAISSAGILNAVNELPSLHVLYLDTSADRSGIVSNLKVTRPRLAIYLDQTLV